MADITLAISGNVATVLTSSGYSIPGWSTGYVGNAGSVFGLVIDHNLTFSINGVSTALAVGSVTPSRSFIANGVFATGYVGTIATGQTVTFAISGNFATGSVGTVTPTSNITMELSGVQATVLTGNETASSAVTFAISGVQTGTGVGTVVPGKSYILSSVTGTGNVGSVGTSQAVSIALTGNVSFVQLGIIPPPGSRILPMFGVQAVASIAPTAVPFNIFSIPTEIDLTIPSNAEAMGVVILLNSESKVII